MAGSFDIGAITATVKADISNFKDGMQKAKNEVSGFKSDIGGMAANIGKAGLVVGAFAIAGGLAIKSLADTAGEAQKEMAKFDTLMTQSFGDAPEKLREAKDAALELSTAFIKLGFDDEETAVAMAKSLAVTKDVESSTKEMGLAADFARLRGISLGDAQSALQMAYMGNARVLKQYGIELEDGATKTEIFEKIQAIAGGQAEAFSNTYAGAAARFGVEFGNLKETLGTVFLPVLTQLVTALSEFVTKLNATDFTWFTTAIQSAIPVIMNFLWAVQDTVNKIIAYFNENFMPYILMLVAFIQAHWTEIQLITQVLSDIITSIFTILTVTIGALITVFLTWLTAFWKDHGEQIMTGLKGFWNIVVGLFQVGAAVISAILAVLTGILTGNWDEAWRKIISATDLAWSGIKNIFNGAINFVKGWGGWLVSELVRPFQDAWNRISDLVNKIKDALDFTKRHSPSVLDIVKKGVGLVNNALTDLTYSPLINPSLVANTVSQGGQSMSVAAINISLDGAYIGNEQDATAMAERIGDSIINKLRYSVRL